MNICFAVNNAYAEKLAVVMTSILVNNPEELIHFYCLTTDFSDTSQKLINSLRKNFKNWDIQYLSPDADAFSDLKLNIDYISMETYYRYVIADMLPNEDKCLYLDADLVVNGSLKELWNTPLGDNYCAGVHDLFIEKIGYKDKIGFAKDELYINAGVLLLNLAELRKNMMSEKLFANTIKWQDKIIYQDQDILNITFKGHILPLDNIYNFTSFEVKHCPSKRQEAVIIHYTGATKPWVKNCHNKMKKLWFMYKKQFDAIFKKKIKIGLLIDEFFGGAGTAFGGYGFLARRYIAKYIPDEHIKIDVLLGKGKKEFYAEKFHEDDVDLYRLPRNKFMARYWLKKQNYDLYLSIELTDDWVLRNEADPKKKLILWIQDPRPKYAWNEVIDTMQSIKDPCFYCQKNYDTVHCMSEQDRVKFISQGYSLNPLAIELYNLPKNIPIQYLPNPIDIDFDYNFDITKKKKQVVFLGRLEAQKRAWLFCELAKLLPKYDFYVLGQFFRYRYENERMLAPYMNNTINNLHFVGHVDGEEKRKLLKESRLLVSTAIWEGIPISWLEALSYGTLLVSDLERENLARNFGKFVGEIPGDGFDGVSKFVPAIKTFMENDDLYQETAEKAIEYIRKTHNVERFIHDLKDVVYEETAL